MKKILKIFAATSIGIGSLSYLSLDSHRRHQEEKEAIKQESENHIKRFVEANIPTYIKEHEKRLYIKYIGTPKVIVGISQKRKGSHPNITICGSYVQENNTIRLRKDIMIKKGEKDEEGLEVKSSENLCEIETTLNHELGHYYSDQFNDLILGRGNWPSFNNLSEVEKMALWVVSEGIAGYFERMNDPYGDFRDSKFPKTENDFWIDENQKNPNYHLRYEGGYHLVKPIIDEFKGQGIEYLMVNPPNEEEALNLKKYQQDVLAALRGED